MLITHTLILAFSNFETSPLPAYRLIFLSSYPSCINFTSTLYCSSQDYLPVLHSTSTFHTSSFSFLYKPIAHSDFYFLLRSSNLTLSLCTSHPTTRLLHILLRSSYITEISTFFLIYLSYLHVHILTLPNTFRL